MANHIQVDYLFQTSAGDRLGNDFVQNLITNLKDVEGQIQDEVQKIEDTFKSNLDNSRTILSDVVDNQIRDARKKIENMNCAHGTETALRGTKLQVSVNFAACINFTRTIADLQQLSYDTFQFAGSIEYLAVQIVQNISVCYSESFFEAAKCVISTLNNYSANYGNISQQVIVYLDRTEQLSEELVLEFKECLGMAQTFSSNTISNILKTNCKTNQMNRLSHIKGTI